MTRLQLCYLVVITHRREEVHNTLCTNQLGWNAYPLVLSIEDTGNLED